MEQASKLEGVLKEYELLKSEILHRDRLVLQIQSIVFPAVGIIVAQAFSFDISYVFLVPLPILLIASYYVANQRWSILQIASYLRCEIESKNPALGLKWESELSALQDARIKRSSPFRGNILVESSLFNIFGITALILYFWHWLKGSRIHFWEGLLKPQGYLPVVLFLIPTIFSTWQYIRIQRAIVQNPFDVFFARESDDCS